MTTRIQRQLNAARRPRATVPASPGRSFGRDVLVNVLANLIAAAVVYLAAVAAGYITADRVAVTVAVALVLWPAWEILNFPFIINEDINGKPLPRWVRWAFLAGDVIFFVLGLCFLVYVWR
ncbi:hypothetical protein AB0F68_04455 [Micromonospora sp. NPDC023966]|uniref:hypothetical protein n=1 Tax=Micromonospora sp. NPDC023966 TaxID=3154699 RepID=UPI0033CC1072